MIKIKCRCGQSERNFKFDIGPFYIEECCEKAGYDALGNKKEEGMSNEELNELAQNLDGAEDLQIKDEASLDQQTEAEKEEDKPEESKPEEKKPEAKTLKPKLPKPNKPNKAE